MKIYSPNKEYTGVSASVSFCNGKGETDDPRLIQWFKDHGYDVEDTEEKADAEDNPETEEKPRKTGKKAVQKDGE